MKTGFLPLAKTALILVYCVIVAGGLVRMTGSGMGCPDWPKCFGYYIPPTDIAQLTWTPDHAYEKGQIIIKDEALWVAQADFNSGTTYDAAQWRPYTKHDYAIFNAAHTWTEYLNRLCGALAGIAVLAMAIASGAYWREKKRVTLLSWLTVFLMGLQAWLGATVVYSVLNPIKITVHMVVALLIVAVILYVIWTVSPRNENTGTDRKFVSLLAITLIATLWQVITGTQVRQFVDGAHDALTNGQADLTDFGATFYIHRSFSIVVLALNVALWLRNRANGNLLPKINWVVALILVEIATGIAMAYLDFPMGTQTAHLVLASSLFGVQFYLNLENWAQKKR